ncbi:MAG: OPT/YSL family transporter, partial [Nannocystaceae bacterium]|nr:OPT/YSL family transporter [Nannocystaceae bacterium]
SKVVGDGFAALPAGVPIAVGIAAALAACLTVLERWRPAWRPWIPSATGLGLAFVLPASKTLSFFIGGAIAAWVTRKDPSAMASRAVPIAAGLIAGESLMGVLAAILAAVSMDG